MSRIAAEAFGQPSKDGEPQSFDDRRQDFGIHAAQPLQPPQQLSQRRGSIQHPTEDQQRSQKPQQE